MSTLRTDIWASALIRRAQAGGAFAAVVARGDADAGAVLVKINLLDGRARLRAPMLDIDGERVWIDPLGRDEPAAEAEADAYIRRRREADRDLWVIEIEDRHGRDFLE
ncbi:MAG: DUF1491 family protein [Maricaulaceae bacterium]|jgi:hypothetical protein